MGNTQFGTKNEKFINTLKNAAKNNQTHITYWCKPTNISLNSKPNINLIGENIDITDISNQKVIASGIIEDVVIDTIQDMYNSIKIGGNKNLGLPKTYNLDDWLWEIEDTLANKYSKYDFIGGIHIRLKSLPIEKYEEVRGNQAGRKM